VTWVKWKLVSFHLEIVLILVQNRYMDCHEHTIGSKIILATDDGTPRLCGLSGSSFCLFGDHVNLRAT
jgi:hypothetical protein